MLKVVDDFFLLEGGGCSLRVCDDFCYKPGSVPLCYLLVFCPGWDIFYITFLRVCKICSTDAAILFLMLYQCPWMWTYFESYSSCRISAVDRGVSGDPGMLWWLVEYAHLSLRSEARLISDYGRDLRCNCHEVMFVMIHSLRWTRCRKEHVVIVWKHPFSLRLLSSG